MPWLKNNELSTPYSIVDLVTSARSNINCYRTRRTIDTNLFQYVTAIVRLGQLQDSRLNTGKLIVNIATFLKTDDLEEAISSHVSQLEAIERYDNSSAMIHVINAYNNPAAIPKMQEWLASNGWTERKEYVPTVTTTPFHSNVVYTKPLHYETSGMDRVSPAIVVITNTVSDEFILRLCALLLEELSFKLPEQVHAQIISAFMESDKAMYINALASWLDAETIRKQQAEVIVDLEKLAKWEASTEFRIRLERTLGDTRSTINSYITELTELYKKEQETMIKLATTYWQQSVSAFKEFVDYIRVSDLPRIIKLHVREDRNEIHMVIGTELLYWNADFFKNYKNASGPNTYKNATKHMRQLLDDIFLHKNVCIHFETPVIIKPYDFVTSMDTQFYQDGVATRRGVPHPHIHYYNCFGNNAEPLRTALKNSDYVVYWEQLKATLSAINLADSTVFSRFIWELETFTYPCLYIPATKELLSTQAYFNKYPEGFKVTEEPVALPMEDTVPERDDSDDAF